MTDRRTFLATGSTLLGAALTGCASSMQGDNWITLLDTSRSTSFDGWSPLDAGE